MSVVCSAEGDHMTAGRSTALVMSPRPKTQLETTTTTTTTRKVLITTTSNTGKFGRFGGKYVPETLITCLSQLESEFNMVLHDTQFQVILMIILNNY